MIPHDSKSDLPLATNVDDYDKSMKTRSGEELYVSMYVHRLYIVGTYVPGRYFDDDALPSFVEISHCHLSRTLTEANCTARVLP